MPGLRLLLLAASAGAAHECIDKANEFCRTPALSCDCAGCAQPDWLALQSGPGAPQWRCYSPAALNANHTEYRSGKMFCTENDAILEILKCPAPHPATRIPSPDLYPSPATTTLTPPDTACGRTCKLPPPPPPIPGTVVFGSNMKLPSTGENINTFRIPSLLRVGSTQTLLAFAEGRKFAGSDFGPKAMCMRRSTDLGSSWGPLSAVVCAMLPCPLQGAPCPLPLRPIDIPT